MYVFLYRMTTHAPTEKIYHFYNIAHIGDNLLNLKYFLYLTPILKEKNCKIIYYYSTQWHYNKEATLRSYIDPSVVTIKPLEERPRNSIELWQGHAIDNVTYIDSERYFELFYKKILNILNINDPTVLTNLWLDEPFLVDVYNSLEQKYKDIDILILNTVGRSGQYSDTRSVNNLARYLHRHFTVVTMDDVGEDVTSAGHLSLKEVGAISTRAKYIISTCSGPHIPCFNKLTKEYVKKWFILPAFKYYTIDCIDNANIDAIKQYFDSIRS